jgi:hypothetical protein
MLRVTSATLRLHDPARRTAEDVSCLGLGFVEKPVAQNRIPAGYP